MKKETSDIVRFYHCKKCIECMPDGESPATWARLSVGFSKEGMQVWCERHNMNVIHIDFLGQKIGIVPKKGKR